MLANDFDPLLASANMKSSIFVPFIAAILFSIVCTRVGLRAQSLGEQLERTSPAELAALAKSAGDAARGAVVFFQPHMACAKCHSVGDAQPNKLGPDLVATGKETTDAHLVESVLAPSKVIKKGFESIVVVTTDGKTRMALVVEKN